MVTETKSRGITMHLGASLPSKILAKSIALLNVLVIIFLKNIELKFVMVLSLIHLPFLFLQPVQWLLDQVCFVTKIKSI